MNMPIAEFGEYLENTIEVVKRKAAAQERAAKEAKNKFKHMKGAR